MEEQRYILHQLETLLAIPSPSGYTREVTAHLMEELTRLGYSPKTTAKGGVLCQVGGGVGEGLLLTAHVDTLGGMVSAVKENGRLRISPLGGLQPHNVEGENCTVLTRQGQRFSGTFQLDSPSTHVNKEYATQKRDFTTMEVVLDAFTKTQEGTCSLGISVGDIVAFDPRTVLTENGFLKSRFLDDKLSAAILLGYARALKEEGHSPTRPTYLHFTVFEEVGHGGAGSIPPDVTEILAVDMGCVGETLTCDEFAVSICAKDSRGPSNYEMISRLIALAGELGLPYGVDVYPQYGSDADAALAAGHDVRHALIGAGVYASHGYERSHVDGMLATYRLLLAFAK